MIGLPLNQDYGAGKEHCLEAIAEKAELQSIELLYRHHSA